MYESNIITDQQSGHIPGMAKRVIRGEVVWQGEFINKEGKWFNYIIGQETTWVNGNPTDTLTVPITGGGGNLDTQEFATQGVGFATRVIII